MHSIRHCVTVAAGLSWLMLAGCGRSGPALSPVEGVIKLNGKPVDNIVIQLEPENWPAGTPRMSFTAVSDAQGRFVLKSGDGRPGVAAGQYKVYLIDNNLSTDDEPDTPGARRPAASRILPIYMSPATSPLTLTVEAGKKEYELLVGSR
jgi:hypothetical protein